MEAISATHIADVYEQLNQVDVIGIDEGQFVHAALVII